MKNNGKCVICNEKITAEQNASKWAGGYNAMPVAEGQCCYTCDISVVLPARLAQYMEYMEGRA
jgi:hypothetical protein